MSKINIKKDYVDGQVLYGKELNINNEVIELGVNDNFEKITKLQSDKVDTSTLNSRLAEKVDNYELTEAVETINLTKASKTELNAKADKTELNAKADTSYVLAQLNTKANTTYVNNQLDAKADKTDLDAKFDKTSAGDLARLNTNDKSSLVAAINSVNKETIPVATDTIAGVVKVDNVTTTVDQDGTIHAVGGGGGGSGTSDYAALTNKPQINSVELSGNKSLDELGIANKDDLDNKANKSEVYTKTETDRKVEETLQDKADTTYVDNGLSLKADKTEVYTKTDTDAKFTEYATSFQTLLGSKADKSSTYTKAETNETIDNKIADLDINTNDIFIGKVEDAPSDSKIVIDETNSKTYVDDTLTDSLANNETDKAPTVHAVNEGIKNSIVNTLSGNETDKAPTVNIIKNYADNIDNKFNYSTDEQRIGTWTNGKPIYRKVTNTTSPTENKEVAIIDPISELDTLIKMDGFVIPGATSIPINFDLDNYTKITTYYSRGSGVRMITPTSTYQNKPTLVILEYTKTTD